MDSQHLVLQLYRDELTVGGTVTVAVMVIGFALGVALEATDAQDSF